MSDEQKKVSLKIQFSQNKNEEKPLPEPKMITEWQYGRIISAMIVLALLLIVTYQFFKVVDDPSLEADKAGSAKTKSKVPDSQPKAGKIKAETKTKPIAKAQPKPKPMPKSKPAPGLKPAVQPKQQVAASKPVSSTGTAVIAEPEPVNENAPAVAKPKIDNSLPAGVVRSQLALGIWENEPFGDVVLPIKVNPKAATGLFYFTELHGMQGQSVYHVWKRNGKMVFQQKKVISSEQLKTYTSKLFTMTSVGDWTVSVTDSELTPLHTLAFKVEAQ